MSANEQAVKKLKMMWDEFLKENGVDSLAKARREKEAFEKWRPDLSSMTLEQYTNLLSANKDGGDAGYFTNWMERKTENCGKFRTAGASVFGIYRIKQEGSEPLYMTSEYRGQEKDKSAAEKYFLGTVKPVVCDVASFNERSEGVAPLEVNYARKIAYMYNPEKLLPLFKKDTIEAIADFIGIEEGEVDSSSYMATKVILDKLVREWKLPDPNFDLTQKLGSFLYKAFEKTFSLEHKNIIFCGAPGTGKTYTVEGIKQRILIDGDDENEVYVFAQFHPSYSYEDFIEGLKPVVENGSITLQLQAGKFKRLCQKAMNNLRQAHPSSKDKVDGVKLKKYYFIADEINRAELSRVLGEVLVCLEESKRLDIDKNGQIVGARIEAQYSHLYTSEADGVVTVGGKHYFGVPSNLYFIGTMNDVDRSIDSFDLALRRRFIWKRKNCDYDVIAEKLQLINKSEELVEKYTKICRELNELISDKWELGHAYEIGHAYFLEVGKISNNSVRKLFELKIKPLLGEYLRAEYSRKDIEGKLNDAAKVFLLND